MRPSPGARAFSTAGLLCLGYLQNANGAPIPQTEKQTPAPQVMLAPAQVSAGQPPPKEPLPVDARKPDRIRASVTKAQYKRSLQSRPQVARFRRRRQDDYRLNLSSGHEEFRLRHGTPSHRCCLPDGTRLP
jgi:hypothetical protein